MFIDVETLAAEVRRHAPFRLTNGTAVDVERTITDYACFAIKMISNFNHGDRKLLGACFFDDDLIALEERTSVSRLRFTMAHELGHALIDFRIGQDMNGVAYRCNESDIIASDSMVKVMAQKRMERPRNEVVANKFASAFLLPKDELLREARGSADATRLAAHYGVSAEAAGYRLAEIGIGAE